MTNETTPAPIVDNTPRIKNCVISEVFIGLDDTNTFTSWVVLNFGQHKQGFGGLNLSVGNNAHVFFTNLFTIIGVSEVKQLIGKAVRVEHTDKRIFGLGNFIDDKWYNIEKGAIEEASPSLSAKTEEAKLEVVVDNEGKKHYKGPAEAGVIGVNA